MKKLSLLLVGLLGLGILSMRAKESSDRSKCTFMGVFNIREKDIPKNGNLTFSFDNPEKYQNRTSLWRAALNVCLAPAGLLGCIEKGGGAIFRDSTLIEKAEGAALIAAGAMIIPAFLLGNAACELALGTHASTAAYADSLSNNIITTQAETKHTYDLMAQSTIINTYDLW